MATKDFNIKNIPLLPLKDIVIFPHTVVPLLVGRKKSVEAVAMAMANDRKIFLITQKNQDSEVTKQDDLNQVGTLANILQMLKMPDGKMKVLVEGIMRAKIVDFIEEDNFTSVNLSYINANTVNEKELEALIRLNVDSFTQYTQLNKKIPEDILKSIENTKNIENFISILIAHLNLSIEQKQSFLEQEDHLQLLENILSVIISEIDMLSIEHKIYDRTKKQMENNQRDYYLNEQMKSIQKELGAIDDENEIKEFESKIKKAKLPKEVHDKANSELKKLTRMSPQSSDASIIRTYIDSLCAMPWYKKSKINKDLNKAQDILDKGHYGLEKIKERILEHLAVQNRVNNNKSNILCLVGPPGVGKTSLGESIASAVNRKFIRMSLGGIRDEAEIRGHRRTYIGAMPGTILQKMQKSKVVNPLFLLDEIDKISSDFHGDPASALLEVLDPEQNHTFNDNYLEVDYDLSQVMFVTTANSTNMSAPLLDRMEIINLSGYIEDEKVAIAINYLIPKQLKYNGLKKSEIAFNKDAILDIIRYYTSEAGVRNLTREISTICRKTVKSILLNKAKKPKKAIIAVKNLTDYLGVKKFRFGVAEQKDQVGEVIGLAWTQVGGDLLTIEAAANKGKGKHKYTGQLGDVMQESIDAAMTVIRSRAKKLSIDEDFYKKLDIHVHVPDGATPKDGPSAGAAMCVAITSVLTNRSVKSSVAMTGEITLRGEITPIGGLKEKLLAALRGGIKTVLIPKENDRELSDIPNTITDNLNIVKVQWIDEVFKHTLN